MNEQYSLNIQRNLEYLGFQGKIGNHTFSITDIQTISNNFAEHSYGYKNYHFLIKIPYCGKKLHWEVIFDPENSCEVPDFVFNDESFVFNPSIDYIVKNVPEWDNWNIGKPDSLINVLNKFILLFRKIQVEKLENYIGYFNHKSEYEELMLQISEENIEIYVETKDISEGHENDSIHFLIFIPVDFNLLPEFAQQLLEENLLQDPGDDFAYLQISFVRLDNSQVKSFLQLSPRVEQVLGGKLKLPKYTKDTKLCEYVGQVQQNIEDSVEVVANQYRAKNQFISTLAALFCTSVIEYDTKTFRKIVFQYESQDYDCVVTISLGARFPQEKPKIQLSSIYCQEGKNCHHMFTNFPYDLTDAVEDIISNIIDSLKNGVVYFKNHRH